MKHKIEYIINNILSLESSNLDVFKKMLILLKITYIPKIITITGTNGKTSTVAIISKIFQYNKINYISHISPHLYTFNERIKYNNIVITDNVLLQYLEIIYNICVYMNIKLNYYGISFLCTWLNIQKYKPTWAILEVGMGGKLDPANLFDADIGIITNISLDHTEVLGNTLEQIALNKVHIARFKKPIILGTKLPIKALEFLNTIKAKIIYSSPVIQKTKFNIHPISLSCAFKAISIISSNLFIPKKLLYNLFIPGRFHIINDHPLMIVDIAHNFQSIKNLMFYLKDYKNKYNKLIAVFNMHKTKNITKILYYYSSLINLWILPDLSNTDKRFSSLNNINYFPNNALCFNNENSAFKYLDNNLQHDDLICAFGSFLIVKKFLNYYDHKKKI